MKTHSTPRPWKRRGLALAAAASLAATALPAAADPPAPGTGPTNVGGTAAEVTGQAGLSYELSGTATEGGSPIVSWDWNLGDGQIASGQVVEHTYTESGCYIASLTVVDSGGNSASGDVKFWVNGPTGPPSSVNMPDIMFIMSDDHGWPFYGVMNAIHQSGIFNVPTQHSDLPTVIQTPHLDQLAASGAIFPFARAGAPKCGPSFRITLTGKHARDYLAKRGPREGERIIPEYLSDYGYISFGYGKIWGQHFKDQGFDAGKKSVVEPRNKGLAPLWKWVDATCPDGPARFMWFGPNMPHKPYDAPRPMKELFPWRVYGRVGQHYFGTVYWLDDFIGRIVDGLEERGTTNDTMVLYMSDNGFRVFRSKGTIYDNGVRSPFFISWPGTITPNQVLPQLVKAVDFLPTILDYVGLTMDPDGTLPTGFEPTVRGQTMRPYLEGGPAVPGREYLFGAHHGKPARYLLNDDGMRLIGIGRNKVRYELYDLKTDPNERTDLIDDPTYATDLPVWKAALDAWWAAQAGTMHH